MPPAKRDVRNACTVDLCAIPDTILANSHRQSTGNRSRVRWVPHETMKLSTSAALLMLLGAVLAVIAFAALLEPPRPRTGRRPHRAGYLFVLLTGLAWTGCFGLYMGDRATGMRLGFFFALLVPAVTGCLRSHGRQLIVALVSLSAAIIIGAPALPKLIKRMHPGRSTASITQINKAMVVLNERIEETGKQRRQLTSIGKRLRKDMRRRRNQDFDDIMSDAQAYGTLQNLAAQQVLMQESNDYLILLHDDKHALTSEYRRLRKLSTEERHTAETNYTVADIDALLDDTRVPPWDESLRPLPEDFSDARLQELFDNITR